MSCDRNIFAEVVAFVLALVGDKMPGGNSSVSARKEQPSDMPRVHRSLLVSAPG